MSPSKGWERYCWPGNVCLTKLSFKNECKIKPFSDKVCHQLSLNKQASKIYILGRRERSEVQEGMTNHEKKKWCQIYRRKKIKMELNSGRQQHLSWEIKCLSRQLMLLELFVKGKKFINFRLSWYIKILNDTTK